MMNADRPLLLREWMDHPLYARDPARIDLLNDGMGRASRVDLSGLAPITSGSCPATEIADRIERERAEHHELSIIDESSGIDLDAVPDPKFGGGTVQFASITFAQSRAEDRLIGINSRPDAPPLNVARLREIVRILTPFVGGYCEVPTADRNAPEWAPKLTTGRQPRT